MQNIQNAAEIQQRVINLVELYRTKVGKESDIAKEAKEEHDYWEQVSIDMMDEEGFSGAALDGEGPHTEVWIKHLMVNEQLLSHFYALVAGEKAEKEILDWLLIDFYDKTVFTSEEETFLADHFKEMVNYIILTPCDEDLKLVNRHDGKNAYTIPSEVLELVKSRVEISAGSKVYYPNTVFAQLANLFEGCSYYCDTMFYAWTKVAVYANDIDVVTLDKGDIPSSCDAIVSYLAQVSDKSNILTKIKDAYKNMSTGGKLILLCPNELLWKKDTDKDNCSQEELRKQLVLENSIIEILQLPSVMSPNLDTRNWCLLIAEKGSDGKYATLIDARFAFKETKYSLTMDDLINMGEDIANRQFTNTETGRIVMTSGPFGTALDTKALKAMIDNNGILTKEGLRKMVHVDKSQLDADNLLPQIYVIERPEPEVETIPLDSICQLITRKVKSLNFDLPSDTPWIKEHNLSSLFHGALNIETLEKADCPNNPPHNSDFEFDKDGIFIEDSFHYMLGWGKPKSMRVAQYRACTYLDGKNDAVIYCQDKNGVKTALFISTSKPVVVEGEFVSAKKYNVFCPSRGVDALTLVALLRMPIVYRQIQAYEQFGLHSHLKDILIPWNKLLINDEKNKLLIEEGAFKAQNEKYNEMKTEYINEIRMRKHDMGQYIFELMNIEDLMRYYIENRDTEKEFCQEIEKLLDNFRSSLGELSILLDNLSKEEQFGKPENFDLNAFLSSLEKRHKAEGFTIEYEPNKDSIICYNKKNCIDIKDEYGNLNIEDTGDDRNLHIEDTGDNRNLHIEDTGDDRNLCVEDIGDDRNLRIEDAGDDGNLGVEMTEANTSLNFEDIFNIGKNKPICNVIPPLYVAPNDIKRAVNNIIDNARRHGFTDHSRKDYKVKVRLSIDNETNMFQIDFLNNGTPLPIGMNKMRYGLKGEKAGKTGGTGLGGNYVRSFVENYHGNYDIFTEDGWTVVQISLPIK